MSGFVAGFGKPDKDTVRRAFDRVRHRGPDASGTAEAGGALVAQNYLRADGAREEHGLRFPITKPDAPQLMIGYDGQIGNLAALPLADTIDGKSFPEERLLLELYRKQGAELLQHLGDAIFAFVISDGKQLLAARDLLGIKTLFYGKKNGVLYFASELKSFNEITDQVKEFPAGHYMTADGSLHRFASLPEMPAGFPDRSVEQMCADIRDIIQRSAQSRIDFEVPTGQLLSGGMDSSVICAISTRMMKEKFGPDKRLKTFSLGVGESEDIHSARIVSKHLGTDHHELIVDLDQLLQMLPEVIYHLEHFDPSLVRSSVANFLISRFAREKGMEVLLSGEGGDEVFCGYSHMKSMTPTELYRGQLEILNFLHSNASLRLDRMNQCNSVKVVTPLISGELLSYSLTRIPPEYKVREHNGEKMEKWIFRKAFENDLPASIVWRSKKEFSQGSGSADVLPRHFDRIISDEELAAAQADHPIIRSKEELYYFRIFTDHFGSGPAVDTVGQWLTL